MKMDTGPAAVTTTTSSTTENPWQSAPSSSSDAGMNWANFQEGGSNMVNDRNAEGQWANFSDLSEMESSSLNR